MFLGDFSHAFSLHGIIYINRMRCEEPAITAVENEKRKDESKDLNASLFSLDILWKLFSLNRGLLEWHERREII